MLKAEESVFCQIAEAVIIGSFELENQPDSNANGRLFIYELHRLWV